MIDGDAPTRPDDVNREGRSVSARLPRAEFVHWLLVDIPPTVIEIAEGACSAGVVAYGKAATRGPDGSQQVLNDYTGRAVEHTSELQSVMRHLYAVFCLEKKIYHPILTLTTHN